MATEKHGLELNLKTNLVGVLKAAGKAAGAASAGVASVGSAASSSFSAAGAAVVVFNQGLELAKKGIEVFRATVGAAIERSMEFRKVGDDMAGFFKDFGREVNLVQARIGDALLPVFRGFIEAVTASTGKVSDLIEANRKLIGTKLIEWIGGASKMLVSGFARATEIVVKGVMGIEVAINGLMAAGTWLGEQFWRVFETIFKGWELLSGLMGDNAVSGAIGKVSDGFKKLGDMSAGSTAESISNIKQLTAEYGSFDAKLQAIEGTVNAVIEDAMVRGMEHVRTSTAGANRTLEEQNALLAKRKELLDKNAAAVLAKIPDAPKGQGIREKRDAGIDAMMARRLASIDAKADKMEAEARAKDAEPSVAGAAGQALAGAAGPLGGIAASFATGNIAGGVAQSISAVAAESESFQRILKVVNETFGRIVQALEPVIDIVAALAPMLADLFTPALKFISKVLLKVADFVLGIGESLAAVWNGIIKAISAVLKKIGGLSIMGKKPLGKLEEWGKKLEKSATVSIKDLSDARDRIKEGYKGMGESLGDASDSIDETVDDMQRSLINVPRTLKVALREFQAADAASLAMPGGGSLADSVAAAGGTTMNVDTVQVTSIANVDEVMQVIRDEAARLGLAELGPMPSTNSAQTSHHQPGLASNYLPPGALNQWAG